MTTSTIGAIIGGVIAAVIVIFFVALSVRTALNRPTTLPGKARDLQKIDKDKAVRHLQEAIRIPTVSMVEEYADNIWNLKPLKA